MSMDTYFCFCCLSTSDLSPLYHDSDVNHGNTLLQLFDLNISFEDYEYDGYICKECAKRLKDAAQFKTQVFEMLNVLQLNNLIDLTKSEHHVIVKKVINGDLLDADEKYEKPNIKEVVIIKPEQPALKPPQIKKEPDIESPKKLPALVQKRTHYEISSDLKCDICAKVLPNAYVYHMHMNQHFPNHICDVCGKGFLTEKRLKRHMPSHRTGTFKCQTCEAEFSNYNTLNSHRQRKHSTVQLYKCPYCADRFNTLTRRALHLARAHGRPPGRYECPACPMKFVLAGNLTSHIRNKHQKVKRYFCRSCGAGFCVKRELAAHVAAHTGRDMFQCAQCPKRYPRKKALIVHMRTHTDDRRFSCEFCGKRFIQKCTLLVHVKTHSRNTEKKKNSTSEK